MTNTCVLHFGNEEKTITFYVKNVSHVLVLDNNRHYQNHMHTLTCPPDHTITSPLQINPRVDLPGEGVETDGEGGTRVV